MTGLIIAGGKSIRLGQDKRFMKLGGRTCVERVLDAYDRLFDEVLIVADSADAFRSMGVRVVVDVIPGRAAMGGLYTGLYYAKCQRVFAAAADMPFISPAAIRVVLAAAELGDVVIPEVQGKLHPMHAAYSKACLPALRELVETDELKIQDLARRPGLIVHRLPEPAFQAVEPQFRSFFNINTPEDLAQARAWIEE